MVRAVISCSECGRTFSAARPGERWHQVYVGNPLIWICAPCDPSQFAQLPDTAAAFLEESRNIFAGGQKFDADKPRMDLLDAEALTELAKVLSFGAKKYADENWRKGISLWRLLAAAFRHLLAIMRSEDRDEETGLPHTAHLMCCAIFLIWTMRHRPDMDDRYKCDIQTPSGSKL